MRQACCLHGQYQCERGGQVLQREVAHSLGAACRVTPRDLEGMAWQKELNVERSPPAEMPSVRVQ